MKPIIISTTELPLPQFVDIFKFLPNSELDELKKNKRVKIQFKALIFPKPNYCTIYFVWYSNSILPNLLNESTSSTKKISKIHVNILYAFNNNNEDLTKYNSKIQLELQLIKNNYSNISNSDFIINYFSLIKNQENNHVDRKIIGSPGEFNTANPVAFVKKIKRDNYEEIEKYDENDIEKEILKGLPLLKIKSNDNIQNLFNNWKIKKITFSNNMNIDFTRLKIKHIRLDNGHIIDFNNSYNILIYGYKETNYSEINKKIFSNFKWRLQLKTIKDDNKENEKSFINEMSFIEILIKENQLIESTNITTINVSNLDITQIITNNTNTDLLQTDRDLYINDNYNILSYDGGGLRGVMSVIISQAIEFFTGIPLSNCFHLIGGTSTGGLISLGVGLKSLTLTEMEKLYDDTGMIIFGDPAKNFISHYVLEKYNTEKLKRLFLQENNFGQDWLESYKAGDFYPKNESNDYSSETSYKNIRYLWKKDISSDYSPRIPYVFVVSSQIKSDGIKGVLFCNYDENQQENPANNNKPKNYTSYILEKNRLPDTKIKLKHITQAPIYKAARATSAAPTFFKPLRIPSISLEYPENDEESLEISISNYPYLEIEEKNMNNIIGLLNEIKHSYSNLNIKIEDSLDVVLELNSKSKKFKLLITSGRNELEQIINNNKSWNEEVYNDGGIYANNPSLIALNEAKNIFGKFFCFVSIGTGVYNAIDSPSKIKSAEIPIKEPPLILTRLPKVLQSLIPSITESENTADILNNLSFDSSKIFRFNVPLSKNIDLGAADNTGSFSDSNYSEMKSATYTYLNSNEIQSQLKKLAYLLRDNNRIFGSITQYYSPGSFLYFKKQTTKTLNGYNKKKVIIQQFQCLQEKDLFNSKLQNISKLACEYPYLYQIVGILGKSALLQKFQLFSLNDYIDFIIKKSDNFIELINDNSYKEFWTNSFQKIRSNKKNDKEPILLENNPEEFYKKISNILDKDLIKIIKESLKNFVKEFDSLFTGFLYTLKWFNETQKEILKNYGECKNNILNAYSELVYLFDLIKNGIENQTEKKIMEDIIIRQKKFLNDSLLKIPYYFYELTLSKILNKIRFEQDIGELKKVVEIVYEELNKYKKFTVSHLDPRDKTKKINIYYPHTLYKPVDELEIYSFEGLTKFFNLWQEEYFSVNILNSEKNNAMISDMQSSSFIPLIVELNVSNGLKNDYSQLKLNSKEFSLDITQTRYYIRQFLYENYQNKDFDVLLNLKDIEILTECIWFLKTPTEFEKKLIFVSIFLKLVIQFNSQKQKYIQNNAINSDYMQIENKSNSEQTVGYIPINNEININQQPNPMELDNNERLTTHFNINDIIEEKSKNYINKNKKLQHRKPGTKNDMFKKLHEIVNLKKKIALDSSEDSLSYDIEIRNIIKLEEQYFTNEDDYDLKTQNIEIFKNLLSKIIGFSVLIRSLEEQKRKSGGLQRIFKNYHKSQLEIERPFILLKNQQERIENEIAKDANDLLNNITTKQGVFNLKTINMISNEKYDEDIQKLKDVYIKVEEESDKRESGMQEVINALLTLCDELNAKKMGMAVKAVNIANKGWNFWNIFTECSEQLWGVSSDNN
jgi:hypothetical protein